MINVLSVIAQMIEEAGYGTVGIDIFIGMMPEDQPRCLMLRIPFTGAPIDDGMKNFYDTSFQIIVRDPNPERGYQTCVEVSNALKVRRYTREDVSISWMFPKSLPVNYPRGDSQEIENSVHMCLGYGVL